MVNAAAAYYGRHPVACALLLGGPVTDGSYHALELSITRLGKLARRALELRGLRLPRTTVDIGRSEEHTSELQSLMRISYAVFCLKKTKQKRHNSRLT